MGKLLTIGIIIVAAIIMSLIIHGRITLLSFLLWIGIGLIIARLFKKKKRV